MLLLCNYMIKDLRVDCLKKISKKLLMNSAVHDKMDIMGPFTE